MVSDVFVKRVVFNRMNVKVVCLNEDGNFVELMPMGNVPLPKYEPGICYIVTDEEYEKYKNSERGAHDFVHIVGRPSVGRANTKFVYLESYEEVSNDTKTKLRITPNSETQYMKKDPESKMHRILSI